MEGGDRGRHQGTNKGEANTALRKGGETFLLDLQAAVSAWTRMALQARPSRLDSARCPWLAPALNLTGDA